MPKNNPPRERRLKAGEFERLKIAAEQSRSWYLWPVVVLAVETAMRRGEILGLRWEHIDLDKKTAFLPMTKNGLSRWVPLSDEAVAKLRATPRDTDHPFPLTDVAFRQAWDRLRTRELRDLLEKQWYRRRGLNPRHANYDETASNFNI